MKKYDNDQAVSGVLAGVMVFIIVVVGALSFIMISAAFENHYSGAIKDPVNSTGIYVNNTTPYESVKTISVGVTNNIPSAILVAFLLAVIIIVMVVWGILKRGE